MAAAILGLVGAVCGPATALMGAALADRRSTRREAAQWIRDQRTAAYEGALRYLLRPANRRSGFSNRTAVLEQKHQREWFDDLVEAQFWMHTLLSRCSKAQVDQISEIARDVDDVADQITSGDNFAHQWADGWAILARNVPRLRECARLDLGSMDPTPTLVQVHVASNGADVSP